MIIGHPAFQWRMTLMDMCLFAGVAGYTISNRRGKSGRSWLVLTRAGGNL